MTVEGISVIIRARDEAADVGRCLAIQAAQRDVREIETILVDGGSSDRTPQVADEHGAALV